ncbi:MAG TPA: pitrilysin family protein [Candidatus Peribacteraceae bacterium]|nr:pitrilysin family protein [Candidatus Peribacteraceae bacterium]
MYEISTLPSGLRVITAPTDATAAVTVLVLAGAGSRYEEPAERGISHFLEHMFFKGGKKYKNTKEVAAAIDSVGGEFNAFTGKEYAGYYVKVTGGHVALACDVLGDMLQHASFPQEEIEKERGVIMEEERMYQDTPMYRAGWDFELLLYGDQPLGWDTIGTEEVIRRVDQVDFQAHKDRLYTPDNLVAAFAGSIDHKKAVALAEKAFGAIKGKKTREFPKFTSYGKENLYLRSKQTEQAHLVLGVPGLPHEHPDRFAQKLLGVMLGGTMSSRMFLNIREARGLCYYISTEVDEYLDAGSLTTRAGVDQSRLAEAITAVREEYRACAAGGVTEEELHRAKEYIKGKSVLGLEDSEERAHFVGKQVLLYPEVMTLEEYLKRIDAVTKKQVDALAKKLLVPAEMRLVVIGSEKDEKKLRTLLH